MTSDRYPPDAMIDRNWNHSQSGCRGALWLSSSVVNVDRALDSRLVEPGCWIASGSMVVPEIVCDQWPYGLIVITPFACGVPVVLGTAVSFPRRRSIVSLTVRRRSPRVRWGDDIVLP